MDKKISELNKAYIFNEANELKESEISSDPFLQFTAWFKESLNFDASEANAMFLATSTKDGTPSVRTVLLKDFDDRGFVFYTNYQSRKGNDLRENPKASILFFWKELQRQIRVDGITEQVTKEESDEYFHKRPFESQIAALSSKQSSVIKDREVLIDKYNELKKKYEDSVVPLPEYWGGYRLIPERIEFWQGRQNRLHDRILYTRNEKGGWKIERLAP